MTDGRESAAVVVQELNIGFVLLYAVECATELSDKDDEVVVGQHESYFDQLQ